MVSSYLGSLKGLQSDISGAAVIKSHLGWSSKITHSHDLALDVGCQRGSQLHCQPEFLRKTVKISRSLEHGLGFLTAGRSKESWTSYVAAQILNTSVAVTKIKPALEFTRLFDSHIQSEGKNIKHLWTCVKTTMLPSI